MSAVSESVPPFPQVSGASWRSGVPLAWRNITADRRRFLRSSCGIGFAVLLMLLQFGFRSAFLESALAVIKNIDGDIFIVSSTKFRFGRKDPFSRRQLYAARAIEGVESVRPVYGEWLTSQWKNPQTQKTYNVQVLGFDPDQPVFLFPEVNDNLARLRQPDTAMFDDRARRTIGSADAATTTELARRSVHIIGNFSLGPDFTTDGTVILSDRNFFKYFPPRADGGVELPDVEFGVVRVAKGYRVSEVQTALRQSLPASVTILTKAELIALEEKFQNGVSPVGPIFLLGAAIGFAVGMLISYQILFTDLSDQLPQYATLKAMGYENQYLVSVVLQQAFLCGMVGFIPAWTVGGLLYHLIGEITLLPMHLSFAIAGSAFVMTIAMCLISSAFAMRRVLTADPAELFR